MADSGSMIQQATEEMAQTAGEVAKDVKDSVGEAIEQGVQSVVGSTPLTPQQIQRKQQEDQKNLTETRRKIEWFKRLEIDQRRVLEEQKQKEEQRLQSQKEEKQVTDAKKEEKKKQPNPAIAYAGKPEFKRGVGG